MSDRAPQAERKVVEAAVAYVEALLATDLMMRTKTDDLLTVTNPSADDIRSLRRALKDAVTVLMAEKVGGWTATTTEEPR